MALTRRKFLTACGATLALGAAGGWKHAAQAVTGRKNWMVSELTREFFEKHVGETFRVSHQEMGEVCLKLARTMDAQAPFKKHDNAPAMEVFAVHFEGPADNPLPQSTLKFSNPTAGDFELFTVPVVSRDPSIRRYEATISRILA